MAKRINKNTVSKDSGRIKSNKAILDSLDNLIRFSYRYLNFYHSKYKVQDRTSDYFLKLIERLMTVSGMTVNDFQTNKNDALKNHHIDWNDTCENCFNIPGEDQLVEKPWQFSVTRNEHGRVHGFFIDNTFYIVWFDPEHELYNIKRKKRA